MFGLIVRFDVLDNHAAEFDALVGQTLDGIREREPGTLIYAYHKVRCDDAQARVPYELFESEEAFQSHEERNYVKHFLRERERYLSGPARVEFLDPLCDKGIGSMVRSKERIR